MTDLFEMVHSLPLFHSRSSSPSILFCIISIRNYSPFERHIFSERYANLENLMLAAAATTKKDVMADDI